MQIPSEAMPKSEDDGLEPIPKLYQRPAISKSLHVKQLEPGVSE